MVCPGALKFKLWPDQHQPAEASKLGSETTTNEAQFLKMFSNVLAFVFLSMEITVRLLLACRRAHAYVTVYVCVWSL